MGQSWRVISLGDDDSSWPFLQCDCEAWASEMLFIGSSSSKCCGDSLQQALEAWTSNGCWKGAFPVEKPLYRNTNRNKLPLGDKSLLLGAWFCACVSTRPGDAAGCVKPLLTVGWSPPLVPLLGLLPEEDLLQHREALVSLRASSPVQM